MTPLLVVPMTGVCYNHIKKIKDFIIKDFTVVPEFKDSTAPYLECGMYSEKALFSSETRLYIIYLYNGKIILILFIIYLYDGKIILIVIAFIITPFWHLVIF